jgi:IPT/TIG domain
MPYRNCCTNGRAEVNTYLFYEAVPVNPDKTLASVTLPGGTTGGTEHIFSIGTSTRVTTASNTPVITSLSATTAAAGQQVTINGSGFGASQNGSYLTFTDNGTNWGAPGDSPTFTIDSWSDTAITFTVPTPSGTVNGTADASELGLLESSTDTTGGSISGTITINYTDGTSTEQTVSSSDWTVGPGTGETAAATMSYRNNGGADDSQTITTYVYAATVPINSSKTVASITFPTVSNTVSGDTKAMHIWAVSTG